MSFSLSASSPARPSVPLFFCRVTQQLQLSAPRAIILPATAAIRVLLLRAPVFGRAFFFFTFRVREESESSLLGEYRYVSYSVPIVGDTRDTCIIHAVRGGYAWT